MLPQEHGVHDHADGRQEERREDVADGLHLMEGALAVLAACGMAEWQNSRNERMAETGGGRSKGWQKSGFFRFAILLDSF